MKKLNKKRRTIFDPNEFIIKKTHAEIILYDNKSQEKARTIIDLDDVEKCKKYKWCLSKTEKLYYVMSKSNQKRTSLHQFIMGCKHLDHKNNNTLDNRKCNLRKATKTQNNCNTNKRNYTTSKYKGVCWHKGSQKWIARIVLNHKTTHLGLFKNEKRAGLAYNKKAKELFGEFAKLNNLKEIK